MYMYTYTLRNREENGSYALNYSGPICTSNGKIKVTRIVIQGSDGINYDCTVDYKAEPGQQLILKACGKPILFTKDVNTLAALYTVNYKLESVDLDGEGRIRLDNGRTYNYDFYLKDHLGSTRAVVNDQGSVTEATMYYPYGTMVPLKPPTPGDNAREKFTGKEFDESGAEFGEVVFDVKITNFNGALENWGYLTVTYTDPVSNTNYDRKYKLLFDRDAQESRLNIKETFAANMNITRMVINAPGAPYINNSVTCNYTIVPGKSRTISLDQAASTLVNNPGNYQSQNPVDIAYPINGSRLYYFGARYYDAELGIFTSTDPADQFWNTYSYCGGDPINLVDPDGTEGESTNGVPGLTVGNGSSLTNPPALGSAGTTNGGIGVGSTGGGMLSMPASVSQLAANSCALLSSASSSLQQSRSSKAPIFIGSKEMKQEYLYVSQDDHVDSDIIEPTSLLNKDFQMPNIPMTVGEGVASGGSQIVNTANSVFTYQSMSESGIQPLFLGPIGGPASLLMDFISGETSSAVSLAVSVAMLRPSSSGLNNASTAFKNIFKNGLSRKSIIDIRSTLINGGFKQSLTINKKGYLFSNTTGEQVRIMRRGGGWEARVMNRYGNYLDDIGNVAGPQSTHGISISK